MARKSHTAVVAGANVDYTGKNLPFVAADVTNKEETALTGTEMIIAQNVDTGGAHNVTITSIPDSLHRTRDATASVPAAVGGRPGIRIFGPYKTSGWRQTTNKLHFEADNVNIEFAVVRLPA